VLLGTVALVGQVQQYGHLASDAHREAVVNICWREHPRMSPPRTSRAACTQLG